MRRRRDKIDAIQNEEGHWLFDNDESKRHVVQFYKAVYMKEACDYQPYLITNGSPTCDEHVLYSLKCPVMILKSAILFSA